jgi:DNA-binding beta-propeller fold protein YncE
MAYVVNVGSGTVTPIYLATNTPGRALKAGQRPFDIAIAP